MMSMVSSDSKKVLSDQMEVSSNDSRHALRIKSSFFLAKIGGGYFLRKSPENYYEEIFQNTDFISDKREPDGSDARQSLFADGYGGIGQAKPSAPEDLDVELDVTLEELYNGVMKTISFTIDEVKHDAKNTQKKHMSQ